MQIKYIKHARFLRASHTFLALLFAMFFSMAANLSVAADEKVNLNQADAETLQYIPGIGPSKSQLIVQAREELGEFSSFEQLLEIRGIGEKLLSKIQAHGTLQGGVSELTEEMQENPPTNKVTHTTESQQGSSS